MTDADKKFAAQVDFEMPCDKVSAEELALIEQFLADLIGEVLRRDNNSGE